MSFEIRDLMVKLSPVGGEGDAAQILTCAVCQTTGPTTDYDALQCRTPVSGGPGEGDEPLDAPAPDYDGEYDGPSERGAASSRGVALALLQRQLQQALSQTAR